MNLSNTGLKGAIFPKKIALWYSLQIKAPGCSETIDILFPQGKLGFDIWWSGAYCEKSLHVLSTTIKPLIYLLYCSLGNCPLLAMDARDRNNFHHAFKLSSISSAFPFIEQSTLSKPYFLYWASLPIQGLIRGVNFANLKSFGNLFKVSLHFSVYFTWGIFTLLFLVADIYRFRFLVTEFKYFSYHFLRKKNKGVQKKTRFLSGQMLSSLMVTRAASQAVIDKHVKLCLLLLLLKRVISVRYFFIFVMARKFHTFTLKSVPSKWIQILLVPVLFSSLINFSSCSTFPSDACTKTLISFFYYYFHSLNMPICLSFAKQALFSWSS